MGETALIVGQDGAFLAECCNVRRTKLRTSLSFKCRRYRRCLRPPREYGECAFVTLSVGNEAKTERLVAGIDVGGILAITGGSPLVIEVCGCMGELVLEPGELDGLYRIKQKFDF